MGLHDEKMMKNWSNAYPDRAVVRPFYVLSGICASPVSSLAPKLMHFSYQGLLCLSEGFLTGRVLKK